MESLQKTLSRARLSRRQSDPRDPTIHRGLRDLFAGATDKRKWEEDADISRGHGQPRTGWGLVYLAYQTIGVVYGDIGTSPLYVFASIFPDKPPAKEDVIGAMSLIFYTLTALLICKYALIVLWADDNGNGGAFALYSILRRQAELGVRGKALPSDLSIQSYRHGGSHDGHTAPHRDWRQRFISSPRTQQVITFFVVIGVGAIMGDGVLTPAISVLSACEGLQVADSGIHRSVIVGMSLAIIVGVFFIQQFGTGLVSAVFSPVVFLWLACNLVIGVYNIAKYDAGIFVALLPHKWFNYFLRNGATGWRSLGGVLLCVTGTEALFADLGHFNRPAIQLSSMLLVYPCVLVTYLGQAAWLTKNADLVANTYFKSLPHGTFWPMFIIATLAAIIASQALISAVFQIVYQAIAQGFFPRFYVKHTSAHAAGQVYIPIMNWLLMTLTLIVVATFRHSSKLGQAYGLAVITDMLLTTHFVTIVIVTVWRKALPLALLFYGLFGGIELLYISASVEKIPSGGWFSILMAAIYASIMCWWHWGTTRKRHYFKKNLLPPFEKFFTMTRSDLGEEHVVLRETGREIIRTPGVGLYYSDANYGVPAAMCELVKHYPEVHEVVVIVTNRYVPVPEVQESERFLVEALGPPGFYHCIARYGYQEVVRQGDRFVAAALQNVMELLLRALEVATSGESSQRSSHYSPADMDTPSPAMTPAPAQLASLGKELKDVLQQEDERKRTQEAADAATGADDGPDAGAEADSGGAAAPASADALASLEEGRAGGGAAAAAAEALQPPPVPAGSGPRASIVVPRRAGAQQDEWVNHLLEGLSRQGAGPAYRKAKLVVQELRTVAQAQKEAHVVYVLAKSYPRPSSTNKWWIWLFFEIPFKALVNNFHTDAARAFGVPEEKMFEVGIAYTL